MSLLLFWRGSVILRDELLGNEESTSVNVGLAILRFVLFNFFCCIIHVQVSNRVLGTSSFISHGQVLTNPSSPVKMKMTLVANNSYHCCTKMP